MWNYVVLGLSYLNRHSKMWDTLDGIHRINRTKIFPIVKCLCHVFVSSLSRKCDWESRHSGTAVKKSLNSFVLHFLFPIFAKQFYRNEFSIKEMLSVSDHMCVHVCAMYGELVNNKGKFYIYASRCFFILIKTETNFFPV